MFMCWIKLCDLNNDLIVTFFWLLLFVSFLVCLRNDCATLWRCLYVKHKLKVWWLMQMFHVLYVWKWIIVVCVVKLLEWFGYCYESLTYLYHKCCDYFLIFVRIGHLMIKKTNFLFHMKDKFEGKFSFYSSLD